MTSKQAILARSLAVSMLAATLPGVAHASEISDLEAQMRKMVAEMDSMRQHQADLERRLADSEALRDRSAVTGVRSSATAAAAENDRSAGLPATRRLAFGVPADAPPTRHPAPPEQVAQAQVTAAPPGTIAPNPYFRNDPMVPGKGASFIIPGTDTTIRINGLIKVDAADDFRGAGLNTIPEDPVSIPVEGTAQARRKDNFNATARQSRIGIASETPTRFGPLRSFVEGDFYGTGGTATLTNSSSFRLRQAYLSLGDLTVGQTWSVFFDLDAAPETLDFTGPVGNAYAIRQPLIRYDLGLGQRGKLSFGIENPEGDFLGADHTANFPVGATLSTRVLNKAPDLTGRYTWKSDRVRLSAAAVMRFIDIDTGGTSLPFVGPDGAFNFAGHASTWAFGGQLDAKLKTWGEDSVALQANAGPGIGRYVLVSDDEAFTTGVAPNGAVNANPGSGAVLGPDGKLRTIFTYGGTVWYRHFWTKRLRSNVVFGYERFNDPDNTLPVSFPEEMTSLHANLIWSPLPQIGFGVEYIHEYLGLRGQTDANRLLGYGDHGLSDRIQFSAQYNLF